MTRKRHHPLIRVIHWLAAFLIIAALVMSALVMADIPNDSPEKIQALHRHMATGLLVLVLTALRLVARRRVKRPGVLSSGMRWADWLARTVHRVFDTLILIMIGSGIGMAWQGGLLTVLLGGHPTFPENLDTLTLFSLHRYAAMVLFTVITAHVGGALYHQFILRDGQLSRMGFSLARKKGAKSGVPDNDRPTVEEGVRTADAKVS